MKSIRGQIFAGLMMIASPLSAQTAPGKAKPEWDLDQQYPDAQSWEADRRRLATAIAALPTLKGTASRGPAQLATVLDQARQARSLAGKMARYALLKSQLDTSSDPLSAQSSAARESEAEVEVALSWLASDVAAIGQDKVEAWVRSEPRLNIHRQRLHRIFTEQAYAGAPAEQRLLAQMIRWPNALTDSADALTLADLGWTSVPNPEGGTILADYASYARYRRSPDKRVRDGVSSAVLKRLKGSEDAFGALLTRRIEGENAIAKSRGYNNSIDASFMGDDQIPGSAWRALIASTHDNRKALQRIGGVVRRVHKLDEVGFADFYARYAAPPVDYPIEKTRALILDTLKPLGSTYLRDLELRMSKPWGDYSAEPVKSNSVGVYWQVGGGHPLTFITYKNDLPSADLLAHSSLLMMWYADIPPEVSPETREDDPAVHGNALWYAGRLLFDEHLLETTTDREQRIAMLRDQLFLLWRNFGLFAVTAELEQRISDSDSPMTGRQISAAYLDLIRRNFENPAEKVKIDAEYAAHWMTNDQIFYSHTLVVFPVALAAGAYWADRIKAGDAQAIKGLRVTITPSASQYSHDLLRSAGIDVTKKDLYDAMYRRMNRIMDQLDREVASR